MNSRFIYLLFYLGLTESMVITLTPVLPAQQPVLNSVNAFWTNWRNPGINSETILEVEASSLPPGNKSVLTMLPLC